MVFLDNLDNGQMVRTPCMSIKSNTLDRDILFILPTKDEEVMLSICDNFKNGIGNYKIRKLNAIYSPWKKTFKAGAKQVKWINKDTGGDSKRFIARGYTRSTSYNTKLKTWNACIDCTKIIEELMKVKYTKANLHTFWNALLDSWDLTHKKKYLLFTKDITLLKINNINSIKVNDIQPNNLWINFLFMLKYDYDKITKMMIDKGFLLLVTDNKSTFSFDFSKNTMDKKDTIKFLTPANLKFKDAKLYDNSKVNYNEVIGVFSESKNPLRNTSSDALFMLPSISSVVERNKESYELMSNMNKNMYPSGEAGEFIQHGRDALPSYIEVTIEYIAPKNIVNFNVDNRTRTTTIGLQILPRSISNVDIVDTIADMDVKRFKDIKVSADEKNFIRKMKNLLRFWKKKGNGNELKVLKSNSFADIVSKVEHVDTPMFHLVLTMDDHVMLKNNHKINLMDGNTYRKIMKALPLISISIVDEDTNNVSLSEGPVMNWYEENIDEYIDSISQYEKDLKTIIKYNQYR